MPQSGETGRQFSFVFILFQHNKNTKKSQYLILKEKKKECYVSLPLENAKEMQAPPSKFLQHSFQLCAIRKRRMMQRKNTGGGPCLPLSCTECASEFLNISHSASLWSNGIALVRLTADESEHFGNRKCRTSLRKESSDCLWQMFFCLNHTGFPHYKSDFVR